MKEKFIYLTVCFIIFFLSYILTETYNYAGCLLYNFNNAKYGILWIGLVVFYLFKFLNRIKNHKPSEVIFSLITLGLCLKVIYIISPIKSLNNTILKKNYTGVYEVTESYDIYSDSEKYINKKTFVFNSIDNQLEKETRRLEKKHKLFSYDDFIFWQTAFIKGFTPKNISSYTGKDTFENKIILFLSTGTIYVFEIIVSSIINSLILLLIPVIGIIFNFKFFKKTLDPYITLMTNKI